MAGTPLVTFTTLSGGSGDDALIGRVDAHHFFDPWEFYSYTITSVILGFDGNDSLVAASFLALDDPTTPLPDIDGVAIDPVLIMGGGAGNDVLFGGNRRDAIEGNSGLDTLWGGLNNDSLNGGADSDSLYGGPGDDVLIAEADDAVIVGGEGFDTLYISGDITNVGIDEVEYTALSDHRGLVLRGEQFGKLGTIFLVGESRTYGFSITLITPGAVGSLIDPVNSFGDISGSMGADTIDVSHTTNAEGWELNTSASFGETIGGNVLRGGAGNDALSSQDGSDTLYGGDGADGIHAGGGGDTLYGGGGGDQIVAGSGIDLIYGDGGNDTLRGSADFLYGGGGDDTLVSNFDTIINGGDGYDTLSPVNGNLASTTIIDVEYLVWSDFLFLSDEQLNAFDLVGLASPRGININLTGLNSVGTVGGNIDGAGAYGVISGTPGTDTIDVSHATNANGWALHSSSAPGETSNSNVLRGGAAGDQLNSQDGSDTMYGGGGNDGFFGGGGSDTMFGGTGNDLFVGDLGVDTIYGDDGNDTLNGTGDFLFGGTGDDTLRANLDTLIDGGAGNDTLQILHGDLSSTTIIDVERLALHNGAGVFISAAQLNAFDAVICDGTPPGIGFTIFLTTSEAVGSNIDGFGSIQGTAGGDTIDMSHATAAQSWGLYTSSASGETTSGNVLKAGDGADQLHSQEGGDTLYGAGGTDILNGGGGIDTLFGGDAIDTLFGDVGDDILDGGTGSDFAYGGAGADRHVFRPGNTGTGNDTIGDFSQGNDVLDVRLFGYTSISDITSSGGSIVQDGADTVVSLATGSFPVYVRLLGTTASTITDADFMLAGGPVADTFYGGAEADTWVGSTAGDYAASGGGVDIISSLGGNDTLYGGSDVDTLYGGNGNDLIYGGDENDVLSGGGAGAGGFNQLFGDAGDDLLTYAGVASAVYADLSSGGGHVNGVLTDLMSSVEGLEGGSCADILVGNADNNFLYGGAGAMDDLLFGGDGADLFVGGGHAASSFNQLFGGDGVDTTDYSSETGNVFVDLRAPAGHIDNGGGYVLNDLMNSIENVLGGAGDDILVGTEDTNSLSGDNGQDLLFGMGGDDVLSGGAGGAGTYNQLWGDTGSDTATYEFATTRVYGDLRVVAGWVTDGGDTLVLNDVYNSVENLIGGSVGDSLVGDDNANRLTGGGGADLLYGFGGGDTFIYRAAPESNLTTGYDSIADFESGSDKLDLTAFGITSGDVAIVAAGGFTSAVYANTDGIVGFDLALVVTGTIASIQASDLLF